MYSMPKPALKKTDVNANGSRYSPNSEDMTSFFLAPVFMLTMEWNGTAPPIVKPKPPGISYPARPYKKTGRDIGRESWAIANTGSANKSNKGMVFIVSVKILKS